LFLSLEVSKIKLASGKMKFGRVLKDFGALCPALSAVSLTAAPKNNAVLPSTVLVS